MNSFVFVALFVCFAAADPDVVVAPGSTKIIEGPKTKTTVVGPDGSSVSSISPGGITVREEPATVIADETPVVAAEPADLAFSVPRFAYPRTLCDSGPCFFGRSFVPADGLVAEKKLDTIVKGPSGTIATSKTIHRPALVAAPELYATRLHSFYL